MQAKKSFPFSNLPVTVKSRNGKIAALPEDVRLELNDRLINGAKGPELLPWLNSLPEVRDVLDRHFAGRNINHQNLTAWRGGGYRDWMFRRELLMTSLEAQARARLQQPASADLFSGG